MAFVEVEWTITPEQTGRLDVLVQSMTGRSRSEARAILEQELVKLDERLCKKGGLIVEPGQKVFVKHDPHTRYKEAKTERPPHHFTLLYEDQHLLVVDKQPGILTVPTDHGNELSLVDCVTEYLKRRHKGARGHAVHRLDRETSGALVFAKNIKMADALMEQFRIRKAERKYAVLVSGKVLLPKGTFRSYMATSKRLQRYSVNNSEDGELAITHYEVKQHLKGATYLIAQLETGRRNQIRVHFAEDGHPVLGDDRYRPKEAKHPAWKSKSLGLHALSLGFDHPVTGEHVVFEAPLPKMFDKFVRSQKLAK